MNLGEHPARVYRFVCSLAGWLFVIGCSHRSSRDSQPSAERASPPAAPVTVAAAVERDVPIRLQAIGHVVPFSTVAVRSQVDGTLERVDFQEGDPVKQGDLIFTIDARPYEAALNQAKGTLEKDTALFKNAAVEERRNASLLKDGIVPQDTYDQSRANAQALSATLVADKAAVESAQLQLSYCYTALFWVRLSELVFFPARPILAAWICRPISMPFGNVFKPPVRGQTGRWNPSPCWR